MSVPPLVARRPARGVRGRARASAPPGSPPRWRPTRRPSRWSSTRSSRTLPLHDGGSWKRDPDPLPVELLAPGGVLVLDDMTPSRRFGRDPVRELVLGHPDLAATELLTMPETSVLLATRVRG